jgi:sugar O-acyltransferase (sialic acid O-acetyltransferase NeuD family)
VTRRLVIAGAGEHARVVAEAATAAGWEVVGWVGPETPGAADRGGPPWLGPDASLAERLRDTPFEARPSVVVAIGDAAARRAAAQAVAGAAPWAVVVHPAAWVSPTASLGPGTVVLAGAVVNTGATVGLHAIVNSGAIVEHDVVLGDVVHVGPGAAIGGGARVGDDSFIGLNAAVRDHVRLGARVTVGMGAAVVTDLPDGVTVTGIPAKRVDG